MSEDENCTITNVDYLTSIELRNTVRKMTGMYLIRAINEHGKDEAEVEFVVLGPPGPPEGPLEVTGVHKEGCKIKWKPPRDDGGSPIQKYILEKLDCESGKWSPAGETDGPLELDLNNLETGKKMKFRVKAKNEEGESDWLEGPLDPVTIKDPFDPPGPPGLPEIIDWTESSVKLKWSPPLRENGAPVTHYTIEFREYGTDNWTTGPKVKAKKFPDGEVKEGLTPGKKYEFRVKAENKAGLGDPSEHTTPHLMKARFAPPKIDRTNLDQKVVKVNQQVVIEVDVSGEPDPTKQWFFNGEEIKNTEMVKVAHSAYHTKLMLIPAKRTMVGKYTIKAKNDSGEDEAVVDIVIKGKPGPPEGPLVPFDITKSSCKLKWKPPKDDGGSPIEYYEIEKLDPLTGQWLPAGTSPTCEHTVKPLSEGKEYKFRVRAVNKDGESPDLEGDDSIIAKNPFDPPSKPDKPTPMDWGPDFCKLKWKVPASDGGSPITEYIMEIRDKDKRAWKEAFRTKPDSLEDSCKAPPIEEGHEYEFRVIACNAAGPSEPSDPSITIKAKIRFLKPRIDRSTLQKKILHVDQMLRIEADFVAEPDPEVKWWLPTGAQLIGDERLILDVNIEDRHTSLLVRKCARSDTGIYKILAKNDQGSDEAEVDVLVISVPGKPMGPLEVSNITSHSCHLDWRPPKDDGGDPVKYYIVEKMDTEKGVWLPCGETEGKITEFDVEGLNEGCFYLFRVKAVNNQGESEPLEADAAICAKNPYDPPGPPEKPELDDWDRKWVKISWEPPLDDGGSKITHYVVERQEEFSSKWFKHMDTDTDECKAKCTDLTEFSKYRFRVRAVNRAGQGEPSEPSNEVTCKTRNAPPVIDRTNMDDVKVKVGEPLKLNIKVTGEPEPEKQWMLGTSEVKSTANLSYTMEEKKTIFTMVSAKREFSGKYTLKAKNKNGRDEADLNVLVVGPPDRPQGPMKYEDIFADRCTIHYKVPKDDGGSPITHYIIEKMEVGDEHWIACGKAMGLQITIESLEEGHEYMFRVKAVNAEGESEYLESGDTVLAKNPFDPPGPPGKPECADYDHDFFDLKWSEPLRDGGSRIFNYIIEKRLANDDLWMKCGETKTKYERGKATGVEVGQTYVFRVRAENAGGVGPPGPESDNLLCKYKALKPRIDRKTLREITIRVGETLSFDVPILGEPAPDTTWSKDGKTLNDSDTRTIKHKPYKTSLYVDEATRKDDGVYQINAVNIHGKDEAKVIVYVIGPPGPPEGPMDITGIHKNGCKIAWRPPKDDGGCPIEHYIVEKYDVDNGIWSPVGTSPTCDITCNDLEPGKEYEFRVRAVNSEGESENLKSLKPIVAKDPFTVPLPPSVPEVVDWSESHMDLEWKEPIDDGGSPITGYIIEMKVRHSSEWTQATTIEGNRKKGTVHGLREGDEYQFRIIALNKAGPSEPGQPSRPKEARARFVPPKIDRKNLKDITVSANSMVKLDANVVGEPPAVVTWKFESMTIDSKEDKSMTITNVPYNTKLVIRGCKRSDQGQYEVFAKNQCGKDQVTINLRVIDRPDPPENIQASDITSSSCHLTWRKPKDDGGAPIQYYQVEKLDPDSGLWIPCGRSEDCQIDVRNLTAMKQYKFRVCAVNEEGDSDPCTMKDFITAKDPFGEPGPPIDLEIVDWDQESVDLKWKRPLDDGGSEITGYLIEKKDKSGNWSRAHEVPGTFLKCTVPNLTEGETYEFRVRAINAGGQSRPSNEAGPVTCKARNLPPRIDRTNLNEVRCKAGESFTFDVNVTGEPAPDKKWLINSEEITVTEKVKIVTTSYNTKLIVRAATRAESGMMTITAQNVNGRDSADVKVTVLDVPSPPIGPLRVKNMTASDCDLEWKAPKDDGGMPIQYYIVEMMDESGSGRWSHVGETSGPQLYYHVENLTEGHFYRFRVKAVNKEGKSAPLETSGVYEAKNPFEVPTKPGRPKVVDFDTPWVQLEWERPEWDGGSPIIGYIIERRDTYNQRWELATKTETEEPTGKVKGLIEGVIYEFRVKAVNKAGESEPSDPSLPHRARPKNSAPRIDRNSMMDIKILAGEPLIMNIPVDGEPPPAKNWTLNGNSIDDSLRLMIINEDYKSTIRVQESKRSDTGLYKLVAKNKNGTDTCTCNVTVLDVPGPPEPIVDPKEVRKDYMIISWNVPKDDGGSDIKHYIVEKQDQENMRWVPCGESRQLNMRVDGLIEDHDYLFRIRAVNAQGEGPCLIGPKEPVTAKDPFKLPGRPGKPVAEDWDVDRIDLKWDPPRSDGGSKIKSWIIERKTKFGMWEKCAECPGPQPKGSVRGLTEGEEYIFRITAVNEAGAGEPGEPSDPITAEARYVKPEIDTSALQDMVVCAGNRINYTVPIKGAPKPKVTWKINGKTVYNDDHYDVTVQRRLTIIDIAFSKRYDAGSYSLEVSNELGTATARANVTVLDRPAPPEAPLRLSGVTSNSCNVAWGPSPDDGGSPITHYSVEKMDLSRGSWVEAEITTELKCTIRSLVHKKEYLIRVMAVNAIGASDPLPLDKSFIARNEGDVPEAPGKPEAYDWDRTFIDLTWNKPLNDGGSPIEGYIIQMKVKGTNSWRESTKVIRDINKGRADELTDQEYYYFRVIAYNAVGQSEPGPPSDAIQARPRYLAPKILTPLKDVNVKAGNNFTIDVEYIGSPDPNVDWYVDGSPLVSDERTTVSAIAPITTFHIVNCKRSDTGDVVIKLVNESGSDKGSFFFNILDVPGPPTGPIEIVDVDNNSVTISWRPPKDNGGSEITGYVIEKKDLDHAGGWVPAVNYVAPNVLSQRVPRLLEGNRYEFRVFAVNAQGRGAPTTSDEAMPQAQFDVPGKPGRPFAVDADKNFIKISWKPPTHNGGSAITGYDVERRDILGGRWVKVTDKAVSSTDYRDGKVEEGHQYEYKVRAYNAAGAGPHSDPSLSITARPMKCPPRLNLDVLNQRIRVKAGEEIHVLIPFEGSPLPTVSWTKEGKSIQSKRFTSEVKEELISFYIENSVRLDTGVYQITASNEFGSDTGNLHVTVVDRPGPPIGPVMYKNVERDQIKISWQIPEDDGGCDITGYIVDKSDYGSNDWTSCPGYATKCEYTARGLTEGKLYVFRIRAENQIGVSDALVGKHIESRSPYDPPGPPSAPLIDSFSPSSATISWTPPTDTGGRPITGYFIEKRELGSEWNRVNHYPTPNLNYVIPGLREGARYEFRVIACNEAGPGQPSKPSEPVTAGVQKFPPGPPEGVNVDRITRNTVTLSWRPPRNDGGSKIKGYIIQVKNVRDAEYTDINGYPHADLTYTVLKLREKDEYSFRVCAVNEAGQGEPSRPTPNVTVGEQPNQPKIDLSGVRDIKVRANEDFSVNINYTGYPKPTATFWREDEEVHSDSRIHIQVTEEFVSIIVKKSSKLDAGQYRLKVSNASGYDTATFNVIVLDRPGPPRKIYASDFAGESFNLNWSAPTDTGGSPITNYIVEKCEVGGSYVKVSSYITTCYTRVRNLVVGTNYHFKIYAENQYGISDPAVTDEPIQAKHPFDPPGAPGQPRDLASTSDSITIQWTRPRNDGGSTILGYYIEKRVQGGSWSKGCHAMINDLSQRVSGLQENKMYEFKVAAVNAAGQGPWSPPSDPIRCAPARCAPKITSDLSLRDMTIVAGHDLSITVPFAAEPQPKAHWSINGYEVASDTRITIDLSQHEAKFYNKKAKRSDTGTYNIQLTNSEGSDQASCKVNVVDRPSPPQKPIDAYDITPETCTLSWRPPADDGGSNITNYIVEKLDMASGVWSKASSFVRGLHYEVIGLEPNKKYNFRIRAENQYGISDAAQLDEPITAKFPFTVPDPPGRPKAVAESTTAVNLQWDRPYSDGGSKIQGYKVEYREASESNWITAHGAVIKSQTYTVTGLITGSTYEFQIKATNAAGDSRPSQPSGSFELKAKANPPGPPGSPYSTKVGKNYVDLKWSIPINDGGSKITGYIIEGRESGGTWYRLNDYNVVDTTFTAIDLTTNSDYEFRVFAVNAIGKSEPSMGSNLIKVQEISDGTSPEFIRGLHNCNVGLGKRLSLETEVSGKPKPGYRWLRNGREVTEQPGRVKFEEKKKDKSSLFIMIIEEIWEIDDGEYTCQAFNSMGYTSTSCRVKVGAPPRIEYIPSELHLPEGDNTKIKVKWSGDMPFTVNIYRNGTEITESARFKMTLFDEFLIIFMRDINKDDAGRYTVKVSNPSGSTEESFMIYISGLPGAPIGPLEVSEITSHTCKLAWSPPEFDGGSKVTHYVVERRDIRHNEWIVIASFCKSTNFAVQGLTEGQEYLFRILAANVNGTGPPLDGVNPIRAKPPHDPPSAPGKPSITAIGGDFVNLSWDRPENDGGSRIKGYWIEKREIGLEIWQRANQYLHSATQFNITNLIEGRSYEFRVFAENDIGVSAPSTNSQQVVAKDPDEPQPPEIVSPLKTIAVIEEKDGKFECQINGTPRPNVTWYKGARELFNSGKHEITQIGNSYFLTVKSVFGEDEDTYTCRASNMGGTKSSKAELKIKQPPRLNIPPRFRDSAFFDKGENACIKIPFTGNPKPRINWKKDGETVESGARFQVKTEERHALLSITDCCKDDSGPYTITAENELGTDFALINVQVSDCPDPPRWPQASQIGTDSLVLEWQVPSWDGGSSITNYVVEKQELPMTSWCRVGHTRFTLMPVTGLIPGNEYRFRVFAENVYGRSVASDESSLITTKGVLKKKTARTQYKSNNPIHKYNICI